MVEQTGLFSPLTHTIGSASSWVTADRIGASVTVGPDGLPGSVLTWTNTTSPGVPFGMIVSPHTRLVFNALMTVDLGLRPSPCSPPGSTAEKDCEDAYAGMEIAALDDRHWMSGGDGLGRHLPGFNGVTSWHDQKPLTIVYDNNTDQASNLYFQVVAWAEMRVPAIPEPATRSMWLAGIAGLGSLAMRRRLTCAAGTPAPRARAERGT